MHCLKGTIIVIIIIIEEDEIHIGTEWISYDFSHARFFHMSK